MERPRSTLSAPLDAQNGSGETALMIASRKLMASAIKVLISSGAAIDIRNGSERSALHLACMATEKLAKDAEATAQARLDAVQTLLEAGANVNLQDEDNSTPLHYACTKGDTGVTKALLTAGASADVKNKAGDTALHIAASLGHVECMKCLVLWGHGDSRQLQPASANPESNAFGRRDLRYDFAMSAWQRYQTEDGDFYWFNPDTGVSQWTLPTTEEEDPRLPLANAHFEIQEEDALPSPPPHEEQHQDIYRLEHSAESSHTVIRTDSSSGVLELSSSEDEEDFHDVSPETPPEPSDLYPRESQPLRYKPEDNTLHQPPEHFTVDTAPTISRGKKDTADQDFSASDDTTDNCPETTQLATALSPRHLAVWDRFLSNAVSRAAALEKNAPVEEVVDRAVVHELVTAAASRHTDKVSELMNAGVSPNSPDDQRRTPLHHAAFAQALDVAQLLYDCGANVDLKDDGGNTPVHVAAARGALEVLKFFVSCAADLEAANNDGDRPLHLAAYMGNRDCVEVLVISGEASITAMNKHGLTPLDNLVERAPILVKNRDRIAANKKPRKVPEVLLATIRFLEQQQEATQYNMSPLASADERSEE